MAGDMQEYYQNKVYDRGVPYTQTQLYAPAHSHYIRALFGSLVLLLIYFANFIAGNTQ